MSKIDDIRDKAIDLVAEAINDEDIPAAKRADMALSLLGKQAIKEQPQDDAYDDIEQIEIVFRIIDDDGTELDKVAYSSPKIKMEVTEWPNASTSASCAGTARSACSSRRRAAPLMRWQTQSEPYTPSQPSASTERRYLCSSMRYTPAAPQSTWAAGLTPPPHTTTSAMRSCAVASPPERRSSGSQIRTTVESSGYLTMLTIMRGSA